MNNPTQYPVTTNPTYKQYQTLARVDQRLVIPYLNAIEKYTRKMNSCTIIDTPDVFEANRCNIYGTFRD